MLIFIDDEYARFQLRTIMFTLILVSSFDYHMKLCTWSRELPYSLFMILVILIKLCLVLETMS
jgi:hypothetical protein